MHHSSGDTPAAAGDGDTFRILLATDIHLGYAERDPIRGNDSLVTLEEILENAQKHNVDFVLLGGDLFHENKPSRRTMHGCLSLFRKYCMGDRPVQFEFMSDESVNFEHCQFPTLNYEDPNFNISIPVFSIHGNHDDPTGAGNLCSLDLIHSAGLINYFGKTTSLEKIRVSPLLLQKGNTKLAMYGLGAVRDERLHRLFLNKNVTMLRPKENRDDWFNFFVLHQNRAKHGATNYIPEQFLDDFLDLVVWGHEHECRIVPEWNGVQNMYITQPGSSIATSLCDGETKPKQIGVLEVREKQFKIHPIPLKTVRQFYMEDIILSETSLSANDPSVAKKVEAFCEEKVKQLLDKAEIEHSGSKKQPKEPLIRLRIDYTGFETFSINRFGRKFMNKVANPDQMILFHQRRGKIGTKKMTDEELELLANIRPHSLDSAGVEDMVKDYFSKLDTKSQLQVLTEKGMGDAVKEFVLKEEKEAISELVKFQLQKTQDYLRVRNTEEDNIVEEVVRYKTERRQKREEDEEVQEAIKRAQSIRDSNSANLNSEDDEEEESTTSTPARGRGRGRGQGKGAASTRARGRGQGSAVSTSRGDDEDDDGDTAPKRGRGGRGSRRGRGKAPVVESVTRSVKDMWQGNQRKNTKTSYVEDSDDEDAINISDDDDNPFDIPSSRQRQVTKTNSRNKAASTSTKRGRGVTFESEDTDEEYYTPSKKRR